MSPSAEVADCKDLESAYVRATKEGLGYGQGRLTPQEIESVRARRAAVAGGAQASPPVIPEAAVEAWGAPDGPATVAMEERMAELRSGPLKGHWSTLRYSSGGMVEKAQDKP